MSKFDEGTNRESRIPVRKNLWTYIKPHSRLPRAIRLVNKSTAWHIKASQDERTEIRLEMLSQEWVG